MNRAAVVGGGIAGLAAAYELVRHGADVTIFEARERMGGVIETRRVGGYLVEGGPDSFLTLKPAALELCRELGLDDQIVPTLERRVYIYSGRRLHALPEGMFLAVPTRLWPLLMSGLFSWRGKLRMALDLLLPRGEADDESLGSFVRRRLGREAFDKLAEPLMAGIYLADGDELSLKSTFPRFLELEREHRSLIRGLRKARFSGSLSPFVSLRGGVGQLVERLLAAMPGADVRPSAPVRRVDRREDRWRLVLDDEAFEADAVVLAVPAVAAAELLRTLDAGLADEVGRIPYVGSATISLAYPRLSVPQELDATGFVVPRTEGRRIVGCTWTSSKFGDRAPADQILLRCFMQERGLGLSDADLVREIREELKETMDIRDAPAMTRVFRWPGANPVYRVGHERRVREIESRASAWPGLYLTGAGYRGIGLPDCIKDGRATGRMVAQRLMRDA
ncbi:MAG: protoporphyrinogen oxidase [Planctomycetes bacterium]|nr:protoporphyrinogen oxidase [Planctomycetota bacterium]